MVAKLMYFFEKTKRIVCFFTTFIYPIVHIISPCFNSYSNIKTFQYPPLFGPMRFMMPFCWSIFKLYFTPSSDKESK